MDRVIQGNFADIQNIKSRSVMVLKIEVPIEQAQETLNKLGYPTPAQEIPVAVARLAPPHAQKAVAAPDTSDKGGNSPKSFAQQAKLMAKEPGYAAFAGMNAVQLLSGQNLESLCEENIEERCGVTTCADLIEGSEAGNKFKELQSRFGKWKSYNV